MPCSNCGNRGHNRKTCSFGNANKCSRKYTIRSTDHVHDIERKIGACMEYEIAPELQEEVNGAYAQRFSLELDPLINITLVGPEVILGVARMTPQWLYPSVFYIGAETRDGEWIEFAMPFNPEKYQLRTNKHLANTLNLTNKVNGAVIQFENLDKGTMKAWLKTLETFRKEIYAEVRKIQTSLDTRSRFGQPTDSWICEGGAADGEVSWGSTKPDDDDCPNGEWEEGPTMMFGSRFGQEEDLVSEVLDGRLDVNARDDEGNTALMLICQDPDAVDNSLEHVKSLLKLGADPNLRNGDGDTALILLCEDSESANRTEIGEELLTPSGSQAKCNYDDEWVCPLKYGTNIFLNNNGNSALSMAIAHNNTSLAQLLFNLGASYDLEVNISEIKLRNLLAL